MMGGTWRRLFAVAWKELHQLRRDRLTMSWIIGIPLVQLLLFGYATNTDVRHVRTYVYDQDHSAASRDWVRAMEITGFFDVVGDVDSYLVIEAGFRRGEARAAVVLPAGYGAALRGSRPAAIQVIVDGSDPLTVAAVSRGAGSLASARATEILLHQLDARGGHLEEPPLSVSWSTWYNPDQRTATYIVPGLAGMILTMTMVMFTAMAIARERERGTLEQLIVTPVRRVELIVGKILPYIIIGYLQLSIVLVAGRTLFGVPMVGSLSLLYGLALLFISANLALGIFFSTVAKTQQQAMQMSFFFIMPNILLSGFIFPWEGMPTAARWISQAFPLTHFIRIIRGITLKAAGFSDLASDVAALAVIVVALVLASSLRFRKTL
jgi:ABC-2 type transport system permease protein